MTRPTARLDSNQPEVREAAGHVAHTQIDPGRCVTTGPGSVTERRTQMAPVPTKAPDYASRGAALPRKETLHMVATAAPISRTIDRSACPATRGHGTTHYRRLGCICPDGLDDLRRLKNGLRCSDPAPEPLVDATGTMRRLRAAALHGYSLQALAELVGTTPTVLWFARSGQRTRVSAVNAAAIARVVTDIHRRPALTSGSGPVRAHRMAVREGWSPLDSWLPDEIDDPAALGDDAYRPDLAQIADVDTDTGRPGMGVDLIDTIRAEYLRAPAGTWRRRRVAARHGIHPDAVTRAVKGLAGPGYIDLTAAAGRKAPATGAATNLVVTDTLIHAVRADYLAGLGLRRLAARHDASRTLVRRIVTGHIRPHLGLTDLTAHKRGHHRAVSPGGTTREENAA